MRDALILLLAWMAGGGLGAVFFGGLWWTVHRALFAKQPALWIFGSLLLRASTVIVGFYVVSDGHVDRLLLCLLGFVMARLLVTWLTRTSHEVERHMTHQAKHAS